MRYFKNRELAARHNVSEKAVRNWVTAARQGSNHLELYNDGDNYYIADTIPNDMVISQLVKRGRKFRNRLAHRDIYPSSDLYRIYTPEQVIDIINQLDINRDLPAQYKYFGNGGTYWDKYLHKLNDSANENLLSNTLEQTRLNSQYLLESISHYKYINVVNLCVGNSLAAYEAIQALALSKKLKKIILVDISETMLSISKNNILKWTNNEVMVETYTRDLNWQRIDDITSKDSYGIDANEIVNIFLLLAGPIANFKNPDQALYAISDSMGKNDLFILTTKRDTNQSRNFFDFGISSDISLLSQHDGFVFRLLGFDDSMAEQEQFYDDKNNVRVMRMKLRVDVSVHFELNNYKKVVEINKGDSIGIWKAWHHTDQALIDRFGRTNFEIQQMARSRDQQLNYVVAKVKNREQSTNS